MKARLTSPGSAAYAFETAATAFAGTIQTCVAAAHPRTSTPASTGSDSATSPRPIQRAHQSSVPRAALRTGTV